MVETKNRESEHWAYVVFNHKHVGDGDDVSMVCTKLSKKLQVLIDVLLQQPHYIGHCGE